MGAQAKTSGEISLDDIRANPKLSGILSDLVDQLTKGNLTLNTVGGFTEEEMDAAYFTACEMVRSDDVPSALNMLVYLVVLNPRDARYQQLVGICLQRLKQFTAAEMVYQQALVLDPDNCMTLTYLGESQIMAGKREQGVATLREAIASTVSATDEILERAQTLERMFA